MKAKFLLIVCLLIIIGGVVALFFRDGKSDVPVALNTPSRTATPLPTPTVVATSRSKSIFIDDVPFTAQAPYADWDDPRQQDGCEEASALMAVSWARGVSTISKDEALKQILAISDFEEKNYGNYHDTNAQDSVLRIYQDYFDFTGAMVKLDITTDHIISELQKGNLVVVPVNGQKLGNPNFSGDGPEHHALVIIGYDSNRQEFVTNDPGTRKGQGYRYKVTTLGNALFNYPTGYHEPITNAQTAMIVVSR